jgi:hypothetical protein
MRLGNRMGAVLLMGMVATGCTHTSVRKHENLDKHLLEIDSVVIAPPVVSIEFVAFDSLNERMREEEARIKYALIQAADNALRNHGYDVVDFDFEQALNDDSEFAFRVELLRQEFGFIRRELYESASVPTSSMSDFRSSVGSIANTLSEKSGADAILMMHYNGFQKSTGIIVKDAGVAIVVAALTGVAISSPPSGATVELVMIDGTTGNVLWSDVRGAAGLNSEATKRSMKYFPDDIDVEHERPAGEGSWGEAGAHAAPESEGRE